MTLFRLLDFPAKSMLVNIHCLYVYVFIKHLNPSFVTLSHYIPTRLTVTTHHWLNHIFHETEHHVFTHVPCLKFMVRSYYLFIDKPNEIP
jgi:hypothetical protein